MRQVRSITATLAVLCAFLSASAAGAAQGPARQEPDPASQGVTTGVTTVRELPELRTATSDTFLQSDGSRLLSISNHPINYQQNGAWRPIEDRLVEAAGGAWEPAASPVPVSLPVGLAGRAVRIGAPGRQISLTLQGAEGVSGVASGNERSYGGVMKGVDVSYAATPQSVRETVTLASASAPSEYKYSLGLAEGLHASLSRGGSVTISDSNGNTVSTIAAPTINDSSGERMPSTAPVHYELNGAGTVLTLVVDQSWLSSPSRVFPVRIDPDVYFGAVKDCTIATGSYENKELCGGSLFLGHGQSGTSRLLLNYDLSSIPRGSQILSSSIAMWLRATSTSSPLEVEAYGLSRGFTSHVTWNKYDGEHAWSTAGGDHLKTLAGSTVIKHEYVGGWVSIGFSPQVEQWVRDPTSNFGILLKAHNETENNVDEFNQSGSGTGEGEPDIHVVYEPTMGNPPNEAMFQEPIGNGGTLGVNVANGNLHITNPDVNYATEGYTTQVARSYNSYEDTLVSSGFGGGWRLNMGQDELLYPAWWDGSNAFHEPDGSYTRFDRASWADNHPNPGDKAYTGDAYRGETLIKHENGSRTLTYNGTGVEWQFDSSENGFPQKIVDTGGEGNTVAMSYTESRLAKVTDTHGHALTLTYAAGTHHVAKLKGTVTGEEWVYTYNSEGYLTKYKGPGGQEATYTYNKLHTLESIADPTGTVVVAYDTSGRVASLRKLINGTIKTPGTEDQVTAFSYGTEETTATLPSGGVETYNYDQFGNIIEETALQAEAAEVYGAYAGIEATAAKKAVNLQDHAAILDAELSQELRGQYTGEWFNPVSGKVVIGATAEAYEQTIEQNLDALGLADNAELVVTAKSTEQLEAGNATLEGKLSSLIEARKIQTSIEPQHDAVQVLEAQGLTAGEKSTITTAAAEVGVPTKISESPEATVGPVPAACEYASCSAPLRGGVRIRDARGFGCTAGFITRARYGHKPYLLTAGHCISGHAIGERWYAKEPVPVLEEEVKRKEQFGLTDPSEAEIGKAHSAVFGNKHEGVSSVWEGDNGIIEIANNPKGGVNWFEGLRPMIITYGNSELSGFGVERNPHYRIEGTKYSKGRGGANFVVCVSATDPVRGTQEAECGIEQGFSEVGLFGKEGKHLEKVKGCQGSGKRWNLKVGASGAPVYKANRAYGLLTDLEHCVFWYTGIHQAEEELKVEVLRAPTP